MAWLNGPIVLYHGTDEISARKIREEGIRLNRCRRYTEFRIGFYTTTNLKQARKWANNKYRFLGHSQPTISNSAAILEYRLDRISISYLSSLSFVWASDEYWDFVRFCRAGCVGHQYKQPVYYDIVFGPVSSWPEKKLIANFDQISFHNSNSIALLQNPRILLPKERADFF